MTQNNPDIQYFASCTAKDSVVHLLLKENVILSAYHVRGFDPWLIIFKCNSHHDLILFNINHNIKIKYLSFSFDENLVDNPVSSKDYPIKTWILLRDKSDNNSSDLSEFLRNDENIKEFYISEIFKIFGEYQYIIKSHSKNINDVDNFLSICRDKGFSTSTKCVLSTLKEKGKEKDKKGFSSDKYMTEFKKEDIEYVAARIMANTEDFISMSEDEQFSYLSEKLCEMRSPFTEDDISSNLLFPKINEKFLNKTDLIHKNDFIDRYSIKLNRPGWFKALLFFRAEQGKKKALEKYLQKEFLGVFPNWFSRKLFHMTGDFDFIIPFDCRNLRFLRIAINDFYNKLKSFSPDNETKDNIIERIHTTICISSKKQKYSKPLYPLDIPIIESLLINSTFIQEYESSIKGRFIFSAILAGNTLPLNEEGVSPREDYLRNKLVNTPKHCLESYLNKFQSFSQLGIEATIEFKDGKLLQALFKFQTKSPIHRDQLVNEIRNKTERHELIALLNIPVTDPANVMCIFTVKDIIELEYIYKSMLLFCIKIEVHMIFHQKYYSKVIEQNIRCRPCFNYISPIEGCESRNCFGCKSWTECTHQQCGVCIRYVTKRNRNAILNVKYKNKIQNEVRIALLSPNTDYCYKILNYLTQDKKTVIQSFFDDTGNIKGSDKFELDKSVSDYFKHFYNYPHEKEAKKKQAFYEKYTEEILECINQLRNDLNLDIVVFPEYSIPLPVFDKLKSRVNVDNCIIVAGSHIHNSFNICPIIFIRNNKKEIYFSYKNTLSPFEIQYKVAENSGMGYFRFIDDMIGNIFILICYDAFKTGEILALSNVDILLAPSANISKNFVDRLKEISTRYFIMTAYTNLFNIEGLGMHFNEPKKIASLQDIFGKERRYYLPGKTADDTILSQISEISHEYNEDRPFLYKIIQIKRSEQLIIGDDL